MDGPYEILSVVKSHAAALGAQMRVIIGAVEDVSHAVPLRDTTEKAAHTVRFLRKDSFHALFQMFFVAAPRAVSKMQPLFSLVLVCVFLMFCKTPWNFLEFPRSFCCCARCWPTPGPRGGEAAFSPARRGWSRTTRNSAFKTAGCPPRPWRGRLGTTWRRCSPQAVDIFATPCYNPGKTTAGKRPAA